MKKNIFLIVLCWLALAGCGDFLEEESHELIYARTCADLEELLIGNGYMKNGSNGKTLDRASLSASKKEYYFPWIHVMDDDAEALIAGQEYEKCSFPILSSFYKWEKDPFNNQGAFFDDPVWAVLYEHIAVLNVILSKVEEFVNDTEEARNSVRGQCYFLRAAYYYLLVNFYAKPYEEATAADDLGVPLKLTPVVEDKNFTRTSVDSVYNHIVSDLKLAVDCLKGIKMRSYNRANEDAARILLSRVYCYMGKWELVPELCREVLKKEYALKNLKAAVVGKDTWLDSRSPEVIFTQGSNVSTAVFHGHYNNQTLATFKISPELEKLFDWKKEGENKNPDCRKDLLCYEEYGHLIPRKLTGSDTAFVDGMATYVSDCFLIRLPEVYLNLAEALAMTNQDGEARTVLKTFMDTRISNLGTLTESGESLVKLIRDERRRELCFEGHRWFDLRRYAVSPKYPEAKSILHRMFEHNGGRAENDGAYVGYYQLPAYPDGGWVLPIPAYEIEATDGALINNERENCLYYEY